MACKRSLYGPLFINFLCRLLFFCILTFCAFLCIQVKRAFVKQVEHNFFDKCHTE